VQSETLYHAKRAKGPLAWLLRGVLSDMWKVATNEMRAFLPRQAASAYAEASVDKPEDRRATSQTAAKFFEAFNYKYLAPMEL